MEECFKMYNKKLIGVALATAVVLLGVLITFFNFVERVPEGQVSVVYTPSGGATETLSPGWHLIGLFEKTQQYPTRVTIVNEDISVTTSDGKKIAMPVKYEMKVDKGEVLNIFKELGSQDLKEIQSGYLYQKLFKSARNAVSEYSVIDIYGQKTSEASAEVTESFAKSVEKLGFIIADVTLGTPELDATTQAAIDERVQAAQQLEKLALEKEIATVQAEKKKIEAQGVADAKIVEAEGTAKANKLLEQSLTSGVLQKMYLDKWNGQLPQVSSDNASPIVQMQPFK